MGAGLHGETAEEIQRIQIDAGAGAEAEAPSPQGPTPNPKRKIGETLKAPVWQHYIQGEVQGDGSYTATCKYCGHVYPMGNQKGTSNMKNHIKRGCKKIPAVKRHKPDALQRLLQAGTNTAGEATITPWIFDQKKCRKSFAMCVMAHEYPFYCASHHFLKVFLQDLQPEFTLPSRYTVRQDCLNIYEEERCDLYAEFARMDCKFSFTSDLWSNKGRDWGFMALTCHYIDTNWKMKKRIISFTPLPSPHTGKHISKAIYQKLVGWNLDKRIFSLTLDNSSANDVCIKELLNTPLKNHLPANGEIFHFRCGCHILNLIVQDGLAVLEGEIKKIRETMKYLRNSQARMEKFVLAANQAQVPYKKPQWDVQTRWNSTYLMLERALDLRQAIERYATIDNRFLSCPTEIDWQNVEALVCHLKVFYEATKKLSGSKYPTLNIFFTEYCEVYLTIKKMCSSPFPFIVDMSKEMLLKWEKYWTEGNALLALACVLDPRCQLAVVEYYYKTISEDTCTAFMDNIKVCLNSLFKYYVDEHTKSGKNQASSSSGQQSRSSSSTTSDTRAGLKDFLSCMRTAVPVKTDLEEYLATPLDHASVDAEFDILAWWKLKAPKYPMLATMARDILAVPISTVASESTFSTAGRTLSPVRGSLNDESLQALICAQDWLRASISENGGAFGDVLWSSDGAPQEHDDSVCGSTD